MGLKKEVHQEIEKRISELSFDDIVELIKTTPERHKKYIESYMLERDAEKFGRGLFLSIYQQITEEVTK